MAGLLSRVARGAWDVADPFIPDEPIIGLLNRVMGRGPQAQGFDTGTVDGEGVAMPRAQAAQPQRQGPGLQRYVEGFLSGNFPGEVRDRYNSNMIRNQAMVDFARSLRPQSGGEGGVSPVGGVPSLRDVAPALIKAQMLGLPGVQGITNILDKTSPDIQVANGVTYDKRGTKAGQRIGVDLAPVNGVMVDKQDPTNANRFLPDLQPGEEPLFNSRGDVVGVRNIDGSINALAERAATEASAKAAGAAPFETIDVPLPDGTTQKMPLAKFLREQAAQGGPTQGGGTAPAGLGRSQSPADRAYGEVTAKGAAERYDALQKTGAAAPSKIAQYRQIGALLKGVEGGTLAGAGLELASLANSIGLKIDPKLGNKEAARALSNQLALTMRDPSGGAGMPGAMSDADRKYLVTTIPSIIQSEKGRGQLIDIQVKIFERQAQVAQFARAWVAKAGRLDAADSGGVTFEDALSKWSAKNPLFPQGRR